METNQRRQTCLTRLTTGQASQFGSVSQTNQQVGRPQNAVSASQLRCQKQRCYDSRAGIPFKDKAKSCQGTRIQKGESEFLWVHLKRAEVQKQLARVLLGGPCQQVFCKQDAQQTTMVQNTRLEEIGQNLAVTRCTCCKQNALWKLPGASKQQMAVMAVSEQMGASMQLMAAS